MPTTNLDAASTIDSQILTSVVASEEDLPAIASSKDIPFRGPTSDNMKYFLIGYPLAIKMESANKVNIGDYPWLAGIVNSGETIVTPEQAAQFLSGFKDNNFFAIALLDGTTKYYNIDVYNIDLIPGKAYVKAYFMNDFEGKPSKQISEADVPFLKIAIENMDIWTPLDEPSDASALKTMLDDSKVKNFEVVKNDGKIELYNIRLIDSAQETVS
ncbi:hypothetical protein [Candidatus Nitrososphaera evergladensis]|nr:hypothetical protein [Candidatus Nitrososphaera evergladensis]